jgi:hypothetical protein
MYLLDFRRGVVEEIDERVPPRGSRDAAGEAPEPLPEGKGYVLAALGSPPRDDED